MKMSEVLKILIVFVLLGIIASFLEYKSKQTKNLIFKEGNFAIGQITKLSRGGSYGATPGYYFTYSDTNGQVYHNRESHNLPSIKERRSIKPGALYLVIYHKKGARLLFDYPINERSDFENYVKEIEEKRTNQK